MNKEFNVTFLNPERDILAIRKLHFIKDNPTHN